MAKNSEKLIEKMFNLLIAEKDSSITQYEQLVENLSAKITEQTELIQELQSLIPVKNSNVAGFHKAGVVNRGTPIEEDVEDSIVGFHNRK